MKTFLFLAIVCILSIKVIADEGMWIPMLLGESTIKKMKEKGFKLEAEDIYSINKSSMKDAVVLFGRGCTGEFISEKGLLLTNHHCGYGAIQRLSTLEKNYLENGFWAKNINEELPCQGLSISILVRMEDVSNEVLKDITFNMTEAKRQEIIQNESQKLINKYSENNRYRVEIKPLYYGNQYFMYIYEVFKDVRLVGTPPSSIGKFGGDTDNWMWPRHTGDFALFRVYANKNNEPAEYSPDNVPYKPKKYFPISLKGIKEGDFTMVFGFPGKTQQYIPSYAIDIIQNVKNPHEIKLQGLRLDVIKSAMDTSRFIRIQYANKQAGIANFWKKAIGENEGLKKLNTYKKKQEMEVLFSNWAMMDPDKSLIYGNILQAYENSYSQIKPYILIETYYFEAILAVEIIAFCSNLNAVINSTDADFKNALNTFIEKYKNFYKNYQPSIDKNIFSKMIKELTENIQPNYIPKTILQLQKKHKNNWDAAANYVFNASIFKNISSVESLKFLPAKKAKSILINDPFYKIFLETSSYYNNNISPFIKFHQTKIDSLNRLYIIAQMEMYSDKDFYPDANLTLRVSYGTIGGYTPRDGVEYLWNTTIDGIFEKEDTTIYDYIVPEKLKELFKNKDFGEYAINGTVPVCFIANNHTTGGNSGSPVLNAYGELIGCNFDRTWESTMSDLHYDNNRCRNICLDVRYILFIIDKFANSKHLIEEMTIIR
jgi:hypothetical protein